MRLAGLEVPTPDVLELAVMLRRADDADADTMENAVATDQPVAPAGPLSHLRGVLLAEHGGRVRDGLA